MIDPAAAAGALLTPLFDRRGELTAYQRIELAKAFGILAIATRKVPRLIPAGEYTITQFAQPPERG